MRNAPDVVRAVHKVCFGIGCNIITTNGFWTSTVKPGQTGLGDKAEVCTRLAGDMTVEGAGPVAPRCLGRPRHGSSPRRHALIPVDVQ